MTHWPGLNRITQPQMTAEAILSKYDGKVAALGLQTREYLLWNLPGISEEVDQSASLLGYSYGPGYKNVICVILLSKKGVKIGFNRGGELPDPQCLLTGTGKVHRFVVIRSAGDLDNPALKELLDEAARAHRKRINQTT